MQVLLSRVLFIVATSLIGLFLGATTTPILDAGLGAAAGVAAVLLEHWLRTAPTRAVIGGVAGLLVGLTTSILAGGALEGLGSSAGIVSLLLTSCLAYLGAVIGVRRGLEVSLPRWARGHDEEAAPLGHVSKVLDTSVIIDGRIADVITAGFLEGPLVVPQFILWELQHVADSSDGLKRNRGRKGLDILRSIQRSDRIEVEMTDEDFPDVRDVDGKLLALAEKLGAKILTNDYNLNKVAQLRGVQVLNVNDLANAMKPVVLPGETLDVQIVKEGKERNQGVGYLDDGTMVVVDNGRSLMGEAVEVVVTSVIQTNAGKMIFGAFEDDEAPQRPRIARRNGAPGVPSPDAP